jgi:hypothetical protein
MLSGEQSASSESDEIVTTLQEMGFSQEEAVRLAFRRSHFEEEIEYQERLAVQRRLQFAQWLVHTGRLKR